MYNRGVSGNHVVDLYARIKTDIINLKPDYMSILIGVNDVWHTFDGQENGVEAEKYFRIYSTLIGVKYAFPLINTAKLPILLNIWDISIPQKASGLQHIYS